MPRPVSATYVNHWTSAVGALAGVLRTLGSSLTPAEVDVFSGHAFRLALTRTPAGAVGADGPACFSSRSALPLYESLGLRMRALEAAPDAPDFAARRVEALHELRRATERGRPAIAFGLHLPDFGIVRGVDEAGGALIVSTTMSPQYGERLPLAQWPPPGRPLPLRVFLVEKELKLDRKRAHQAALAFACAYAQDGEQGAVPGCELLACGLAAFARWAELLEGESAVAPEGQAYCIQALQQARHDASIVLRAEAARQRAPALAEAAAAYAGEVLELSRMATLFPYPNGGDVRSAGGRRAGAAMLRRARDAEERALAALARL